MEHHCQRCDPYDMLQPPTPFMLRGGGISCMTAAAVNDTGQTQHSQMFAVDKRSTAAVKARGPLDDIWFYATGWLPLIIALLSHWSAM